MPLPRPSRPDTTEIHATLELAVHAQEAALARTLTLRSPPAPSTDSWFEDTVSSHGLPACEISSRWSLTAMAALRDAGSVLAPAEYRTDPSPCPSVGAVIASQDASLFAVHWQSRFVVIRTEPEPPDAGTDAVSAVTCKAHFVDDGAVMLSVCEEDPQADTASAAVTSVADAVNEREARRRPTVDTVV